jgi:hypothetical protein
MTVRRLRRWQLEFGGDRYSCGQHFRVKTAGGKLEDWSHQLKLLLPTGNRQLTAGNCSSTGHCAYLRSFRNPDRARRRDGRSPALKRRAEPFSPAGHKTIAERHPAENQQLRLSEDQARARLDWCPARSNGGSPKFPSN